MTSAQSCLKTSPFPNMLTICAGKTSNATKATAPIHTRLILPAPYFDNAPYLTRALFNTAVTTTIVTCVKKPLYKRH